MPKLVEERTHLLEDLQDLEDFAQIADQAAIMPALAPDGTETRFQLVQNLATGDYVSSMGGTYELVQHETVVLSLVNALREHGIEVEDGFIKQRPNSFRILAIFNKATAIPNDPSPHKIGVVVRNSYDGTTSVEVSLLMFRGHCDNGMIFGREDLLGGKFKHKGDVLSRIEGGFLDYIGNLDLVVADYTTKLTESQKTVWPDLEEMEAALTTSGLNKKLVAHAKMVLPAYIEDFGQTTYALYQSATDAITHWRTQQGDSLNAASTDRMHSHAEKLLMKRPKTRI